MVQIGRISEEVVRELGSEDRTTRTIYDSYFKARESARAWTEISDGRYITARQKALDS